MHSLIQQYNQGLYFSLTDPTINLKIEYTFLIRCNTVYSVYINVNIK